MFAIAFDLTVADTERLHPGGTSRAYEDIARVLRRHGFERVQGSVYRSQAEDLVALLTAMNDLRALPWFPGSVRDIRAFRVEQWSDFTGFMQGNAAP